ncbi:plastocyanin/azurin family copper-binding protein [Halobacteria archaeon AArc-m2/3/4]|uniref:Plastocyanin/azurin family copper-binding protein n=1 Tax=Natronoglomus mannanivorans TaxID=2979990 RepID=A0AAP2YXP0_9EURY|nr:plastocyanin/azurin family copper-binding protein [Halobacteria archaeon AArc-xg1-1]MCU4973339.1 plastocyanin/azurin family copper-binding protein [Halobacteria archaeon AArc-m2/3/4]
MNPLEDDESLSRRGFLVGTAGAAATVGASATAMAQEDDENGEEDANGENGEEEENGDEEADGENGEGNGDAENGGGGTETVAVGDNYYEPEDLAIEPGTTVQWVWEGSAQHNVNPTDQPDGADWEGHVELQDSGEYEHTFDAEGDYAYTCDPHPGMDGTITVDPDAGQMASGPVELVPDAAWTLIIATVAGMLSTLSLVYFFMRYGGASPE